MRLVILFLLIPFTVFSQKIRGRVVDADDGEPVPNASIFLSNAMASTAGNAEGYFVLAAARPGQYELVVSVVGFDSYHTMILVENADIDLKEIKIKPKITELAEVNVGPDKDWFTKYDLFKREFLGSSALAKKCKILNPEVLALQFEKGKTVLTGSGYDFLEVENAELGYKIKYQLNKFIRNSRTGLVYYEGTALFAEMKGSRSKIRRWQKNRYMAYLGSTMHFLRSVIQNRIDEENFEVRRLIRPDSARRRPFGNAQMLVKTPLKINDFVLRTEQSGIYALSFSDYLYVMYTQKRKKDAQRPAHMPPETPDYPASVIGFDEKYALFDRNGIVINPASIVFEGMWGGQRIAEMLPVDYVPPAEK